MGTRWMEKTALSAADKENILSGNAKKLLRM
jgi:predicted TIM-barrel fold metal-dependent hydrolase